MVWCSPIWAVATMSPSGCLAYWQIRRVRIGQATQLLRTPIGRRLDLGPPANNSLEQRQAGLDQQSGVDEGIADPIAIADELGFELPALWPTRRRHPKPRHLVEAGDHRRLRRVGEGVVAVSALDGAGDR